MSEVDKLWCAFREMGDRVTELEVRLSLVEDDEDVTLEDWPEDPDDDDDEDFGPVEWDEEDDVDELGESGYFIVEVGPQARQEVTDEPES